jgi:hypothetical protein
MSPDSLSPNVIVDNSQISFSLPQTLHLNNYGSERRLSWCSFLLFPKVEPDFLPKMKVVLITSVWQILERFACQSKLTNFFYFINLTQNKYTLDGAHTERQLRLASTNSQITGSWKASAFAFIALFCWIASIC